MFDWIEEGELPGYAKCTICSRDFSVKHGGVSDVKQHQETKYHKTRLDLKGNKCDVKGLEIVLIPSVSKEEDKIIAAEMALIYHTVKHDLSFHNMNCGNKLFQYIINDGTKIKNFSCGRTKAQVIVKDVISPRLIERFVNRIVSDNLFFSIATDISNKMSTKMFPICIRYFTPDGIQTKLLDFYEKPTKPLIKQILEVHGLSINNVSAYSLNDPHNERYSEFSFLKGMNNKIIEVKSAAVAIFQGFIKATNQMEFDIEIFVFKLFSYFTSIQGILTETNMNEFINFIKTEYKHAALNAPPKILTFAAIVEKILENYSILATYFNEADEYPKIFNQYFSKNDDKYLNRKTEIYLTFFNEIFCLISEILKKVESKACTYIETCCLMNTLQTQLLFRVMNNMAGKIEILIKPLPSNEIDMINNSFRNYHKVLLETIEQFWNFDNTIDVLQCLNTTSVSYADFEKIVDFFNLEDRVDRKALLKEVDELEINKKNFTEISRKNVNEKWTKFFKSFDKNEYENIFNIVSFVLSIPGSDSFIGQVFSNITSKWTSNRNRTSFDLIKSEIIISVNCDMSCTEFFDYVQTDEELLSNAKSQKKYGKKTEESSIAHYI